MNSWAFEQLNRLTPSPGNSPANGPGADADRSQQSLSFPVSGLALSAQLEQWTNFAFDEASPKSADCALPKTGDLDFNFNFDSFSPIDSIANPALDPYGPIAPSLVDPALNLPNVLKPAAAPALPLFGQSAESDIISSLGLPIVDDEPVPAPAPLPSLPPTVAVSAIAAPAPAPVAAARAPVTKPAPKRKRASAAASAASSSTSPATIDTALTAPSSSAGTPATTTAGADDDAANQLALEEDKRRRNTAASARFRVKKKMREAALETTAKELRDRVEALEREVDSLRTENGWLKGMLVESGSTNGDSTLARLEDEGLIARKRVRTDDIDINSILV